MTSGNTWITDTARRLPSAALRAYAHPLRLKMIQYLNDHGSATATQLGAEFGESTGQTSYHLRQLAKHGLVEDDATRGTGRERWWKSTSFHISTDEMVREEPGLRGAAQIMLGAVVQGRSDALRSWLAQLGSAPMEWVDASTQDQTTIHLTPEETHSMNKEISAVMDRWIALSQTRKTGDSAAEVKRVRIYHDVFPLLDQVDEDARPHPRGRQQL